MSYYKQNTELGILKQDDYFFYMKNRLLSQNYSLSLDLFNL